MPGPRRAAVLGSPISHSLSPALHRAAYSALGLNWTYEAIEVGESGLAAFMASMDESWAGLSLTMPLKEAVIDLLGEVDEVAMRIRSVNTVLPSGGGWRGTNTDVYGMVRSLREAGVAPNPRTGLILGAGATARSAVAALSELGVQQVFLAARRPEAAAQVQLVAQSFGMAGSVVDWADATMPTSDITVSTVPGDAGAAWQEYARGATGALLDAAYYPWPTPLARAWRTTCIARGRDMLLWQAVEQVRLMTGLTPPVDAMRGALPAD